MSGATPVVTTQAPAPAGPYSQAILAGGFVFIAGQTPKLLDGTRLLDRPFDEQVRQTMENLRAVAVASGGTLADAVKVNVFLRPGCDVAAFNAIYETYVSHPLPARITTISDLAVGDVEIDAVLWLG
ncbi:reactive intermediate/imine deaminase [Conyzicola lurida]|uniref:Reactive intermediate/imine deaminase n=1 Tax=Conyzicola lurida TaxID=1172621 RepID=A0A841AII4_9MICO|nr:reactive intermediate/imine deaminase [Conyzicola lurida]